MKNQPILIIFGTQHPEETWHQKNINVPTSPTDSCCPTLESAKLIFQLYAILILIKQLILQAFP